MQAIKAASGQGWSRAAVAVGVALSVAGNATETVLTESPVHLAIRIIIAISLPALVGIAVEVFVRVAWRRTALDFFGRTVMLLLPGAGAAYVSFGHLYALSVRGGADQIGAAANALAIDGMMIGGTVALLAIRAARLAEALAPAPVITFTPIEPTPIVTAIPDEPIVTKEPETVITTRRPRASSEALEKAVRMLIERTEPADVVAASGLSLATVRLYAKAVRVLRDNPQADIGPKLDGRAVKADMIAIIRDAMNRERPL